jgi:MEMO1 family protein
LPFETPLGALLVDRSAIEELRVLPSVGITDAPHVREHSVEMQLPFLQRLLGRVEIVPLVVGDANAGDAGAVLVPGSGAVTRPRSSSVRIYRITTTPTRRGDATPPPDLIESSDGSRLGPNDACGFLAIAGLLAETRKRGFKARRLDLRNSGDTVGSTDRVVGYGAWCL